MSNVVDMTGNNSETTYEIPTYKIVYNGTGNTEETITVDGDAIATSSFVGVTEDGVDGGPVLKFCIPIDRLVEMSLITATAVRQ